MVGPVHCYHIAEMSREMVKLIQENEDCFSATVHSVFTSSCNLRLHDRLLTLQDRDLPRTPMSLCCLEKVVFDRLPLHPGQEVIYLREQNLLQAGNVIFAIAGALSYSSSPDREKTTVSGYAGYLTVLEEFLKNSRGNIFQLITIPRSVENSVPLEKELAVQLTQAVSVLKQGFLAGDEYSVLRGIDGLLGLGPGLTPAGDDFLLGYLLALSFNEVYSTIINKTKNAVLARTGTRTTEISREFIYYFYQDCYPQPVLALVESINRGDLSLFRGYLPAFLKIGHTSGLDYLSGVCLGLSLLAQEER